MHAPPPRGRLSGPQGGTRNWLLAFALVYLTFFLDNVLLTVLVPIIPDWVRGADSLAAAEARGAPDAPAPLARLLNATVQDAADAGAGGSALAVGAVLSAKALAQLLCAGPAAAAVGARGPRRALRAGTALLALAAAAFAGCSRRARAGACAGAARAAHGAGAALCGVAGLALAQVAAPAARRDRATAALLGAVALGVLVGYPFGGAAAALSGAREAPFLALAAALLLTLFWQHKYLDAEEFDQGSRAPAGAAGCGALAAARDGACGACAGAVLLSTAVMAALEPCLPLWIMERFHPEKWVSGAVFLPDSVGYVLATSLLGGGGAARALGAERLALAGQALVGLAALAVPLASSVPALAGPHAALGWGLGAVDAALVPALLARRPAHAPRRAALLQAAASAAYVLGPVAGGLVSWWCGFPTTMRALGVLNLLYAAYLYRALSATPLSKQWGALSESEDSDEEGESEDRGALRTYAATNSH